MKKLNILFAFFVCLIMMAGKMMSQLGPDSLPIYQEGKIYLQIKSNSNVNILHKDTVINDPNGSFQTLFNKYEVVRTELPYTAFNSPKLNKVYRISFNKATKVDSFIIDLTQISSNVEYVERVPAVYTFSVPNDPVVTNSPTVLYHLSLLNANQASNIHISNGNAIVAVVDDAILKTHEDLVVNIGSINTGSDVADGDSNFNPPLSGLNAANGSVFSHGTHVAGIAGAETDNGKGIASIGWNNKIMCVKTCANNSNPLLGLTNPYDGLTWAATHGAQVINMSWGSYGFSLTDYNVVVAAKNNNVVLVAAAGNNATSSSNYPAAYGEGTTGQSWEVYDKKLVVAVASLDQNNNASIWGGGSGSNYGTWVDIAAYGSDIYSTLASSSSGSAIINSYGLMSGTSMAAPMISGIVGVMRSYNMSKTANEIIDCLLYTANPDIYNSSHPLNQFLTLGSGRADAEAALRCLSTTCSVSPIVIITPSSASLCANTTLTLTANQGANSYSWSTGATSHSIVVNTSGVYSVVASYNGSCTATASINFSAPPTLSLSLTTNTSLCAGASVTLISASGSFSALVWQPGGMTSNSVVVNPTVNTVYSVSANPLCGGTTATIGINAIGNPLPPYSAYSVLGPTLVGNYLGSASLPFPSAHFIISTDATVNMGATFYHSDVLIAPNVKITVPSGSTLNISSTHILSCGTDMWKGIVVNDGAKVVCQNQSFIEDAITAISSTHTPLYSAGISPAIIWATYTIFNRNYVDISLTDYYDFTTSPLSYSNLLKIYGCVFTCHNYSATWPSAGYEIGSTYALGVRMVTSPTTGLVPPHLNLIATPANLKNPYSNQPSHIAINLNSVGITTGPQGTTNGTLSMPGVTIGNSTNFNYFNLFDRHGSFIVANKSNVTLSNNVFQNTQTYTVSGGSTYGGTAVKHSAVYTSTDVMHTMLNMYGSSPSTGNRFWNCHKGIELDKTYLFWIENAIFRSTQSTSNGSGYFQGDCGIHASTNNFDYYIANNEFTNVRQGINIPISTGLVAPKPSWNALPVIGIFAHRIRISNNTFSTTIASSTLTNTYMDRAIDMTCPNSNPWQYSGVFIVPNVSVTPYTQAFSIKNNLIGNAYNGVSVNGSHGFQVDISENDIFLKDNGTQQFGISLNNCLPTTSNLIGKNIISQNTASFSAAPSSTTSNQSSLIFCGDNGFGVSSPSVSCNELTQSYNGFVFDGENKNAVWGGNKMSIPIYQAFVLSHTAAIGTQGGTNTAIANQWVGGLSSWTGSNYGTWVTSGSQATNSILYVSAVSSYSPDNNGGGGSVQDNYALNSGFYANSSGGTYVCGDFPNHKVKMPLESDYDSEIPYYRAKNALYRFVHYNDSVRNSDIDIANFYADQSGTSIDKFMQVEEKLYLNQLEEAESILNAIDDSVFNIIETNYKTFYNLHIAYLDLSAGEQYGTVDSSDLKSLAELCPGTNGPVIYQAISLYNTIYGKILSSDCSESGERQANVSTINAKISKNWEFSIYPNPTNNSLNISTNIETEDLSVSIFDLSGRKVFSGHLKTKNFIGKLDFDLINGSYFISINNSNNEKTTKKLLIVK